MKPSVGRIVFYFEGEYQDLRPTVGIITWVRQHREGDDTVEEEERFDIEITLFPPGGVSYAAARYHNPGDVIPWTPSDQPKDNHWCWPPRVA